MYCSTNLTTDVTADGFFSDGAELGIELKLGDADGRFSVVGIAETDGDVLGKSDGIADGVWVDIIKLTTNEPLS